MSEIGSGNGSSYPGAIDTDTSQESSSTTVRADVPNDLAAAVIATQTELGIDPAGSVTDVKTYLQTEHSADGTHGNITPTSGTYTGIVKWAKGADVASANALTLGSDGNYFDITGTTAITSIGTLGVGTIVKLHFDAALTLTHNATDLILPGSSDITTVAGDEAEFVEYASGDWRCTKYQKISGFSTVAGKVVQVVTTQTGASDTNTTQMVKDDTIPQNTEGDEILTLAITPVNTNNKLVITGHTMASTTATGGDMVIALFQDSTADALAANMTETPSSGAVVPLSITHTMTAGTTNETTFKLRAGSVNAGTTTYNGDAGSRLFGGVAVTSLIITEIG